MKKKLVLIVCNAMDDDLRKNRNITTDSPAASRKVFMLCESLRLAGLRPIVLSLGRGKANSSFQYFHKLIKRTNSFPVIYAPFTHIRFLSEFISLFYFVMPILRLSTCDFKSIIFYNRMPSYLPSLLIGKILGYKCLIDLEDGEVSSTNNKTIKKRIEQFVPRIFDFLANSGALLACRALADMTTVRPVLCYYGTSADALAPRLFDGEKISFLISGTLESDTGADLLLDALTLIREEAPDWANLLTIEVTGQGSYLNLLKQFSLDSGLPHLIVHGRTSDLEYRSIINRSDVGLALKPVSGSLANTTFPSKVIEFASAGLLVLTTDISDVKDLFNDGAMYLQTSSPLELVYSIKKICSDRNFASSTAKLGHHTIKTSLSASEAGLKVNKFIFGE